MVNEFLAELLAVVFGAFGWIFEIVQIAKDVVWPWTFEKSVKGKKVLLIGSGDIGLELAKGLAERGARIAFWDYDQAALDKINAEFPKKDNEELITQHVDIRRFDQVQEAAKTLWTKHQYDVDILLNAAGVANLHDWLDDSLERTDLILDVNIKGMVYVARTFMPKFYERRHGHIVTIASLAGQIGCSHICEYSASKHAVLGYMDSLAVDALSRGLDDLEFTTLCPGFIATKMVLAANFSAVPKWTVSSTEEAGIDLLQAILQNRRTYIYPWQARLIVSFKHFLSYRHMDRLLARQWTY